VRIFEFAVAAVFGVLGLRSLVVWGRRPFESRAVGDHVVYVLWILARAGLWFAIGGIFLISATIHVQGRAFLDEWQRYRWYLLVPLACAVVQAAAGYILGRAKD
jgi:hypothetical protein